MQRHPMVWPEDRKVKTTAVSWRAAHLPRNLNPCGYRHHVPAHVFHFLYMISGATCQSCSVLRLRPGEIHIPDHAMSVFVTWWLLLRYEPTSPRDFLASGKTPVISSGNIGEPDSQEETSLLLGRPPLSASGNIGEPDCQEELWVRQEQAICHSLGSASTLSLPLNHTTKNPSTPTH